MDMNLMRVKSSDLSFASFVSFHFPMIPASYRHPFEGSMDFLVASPWQILSLEDFSEGADSIK
ncbi:MAG TPA: hypothetical protein DCR17_14880 [Verrucomicrobiales bacterium]|nr:hypothetical protein [Verrucomicrobiales bacterium]HAW01323.1 hypothetical protein [Verrucomicrobiales bacterium]HCP38197.1 hypothetical protein [Verrucomicrobiales bacterium]